MTPLSNPKIPNGYCILLGWASNFNAHCFVIQRVWGYGGTPLEKKPGSEAVSEL
jgi:hypothetical protein